MLKQSMFHSLVLAALMTLPPTAGAQQARLDITIDGVQACGFSYGSEVSGTATVSVVSAFPFQSVRFKAPAPCGIIATGHSSSFTITGDTETGIDVVMPSCTTAPIDILQISFFVVAPVSGCTWDVFPADGDTDILLADCGDYTMQGASARSLYCGDVNAWIAPYRPDPPDGATDVPLDAVLSFVGSANVLWLASQLPPNPYEDTVCDEPYGSLCDNPFDPGALEPNTTYHWQATYWCAGTCEHGDGAVSDIWSFTTTGLPLAVEESTWGRVKALYRP